MCGIFPFVKALLLLSLYKYSTAAGESIGIAGITSWWDTQQALCVGV